MKISYSFRLSEKAVQSLKYLSEQTGSTDTAIVEQALFHYSKMAAQVIAARERAQVLGRSGFEPASEPISYPERVSKHQASKKGYKHRKRHK